MEGVWTRCPICGHRWRQQDNQPASHYSQLIERNDAASATMTRKLRDRLDTLAALLPSYGPSCRFLEIGCAEGHLGEALKALQPIIYDGIEISRDADVARRRLDTVYRQTAAYVASAPYNGILAFHVLEHIQDLRAELTEWRRLMDPRGCMVLEVPNQSGHPLVISDENSEHLHQFTQASLLCLLHRVGFEAEAITIGHFESAVYPDSIRVTARVPKSIPCRTNELANRFRERLGARFLVYGIGGDFRNYVQPLLEQLPVMELLDSAPERWGTSACPGRIVGKYDPHRHGGVPILACSIRFKSDIVATLHALGTADELIVGLDEIYDPTPSSH